MESSLDINGFEIQEEIFSHKEVDEITSLIAAKEGLRKFGVREFLLKNHEIRERVFTDKLIKVIKRIAPNCSKSIKSIYFDKPPNANWLVNWHQDLTINVNSLSNIPGYKNWRSTAERTIVQPTLELLESIFTIRIHLDNCTKENGALRVIKNSHSKGVIEIKEWQKLKEGEEVVCQVPKGGILIMKPLLLHASRRTKNLQNRRVIHIEFIEKNLPKEVDWKEEINF